MKSINILLTSIFALLLTVTITSCDSVSNPDSINTIDTTKTATISGTVYANLDLTNDTTGILKEDRERAPKGTLIKVQLDSKEFALNIANGVDYKPLVYTTMVDADGNYSIDVPALDKPIGAEITANNFTATQVQADSTEQEQRFEQDFSPYTVGVISGLTVYQDIIYQN